MTHVTHNQVTPHMCSPSEEYKCLGWTCSRATIHNDVERACSTDALPNGSLWKRETRICNSSRVMGPGQDGVPTLHQGKAVGIQPDRLQRTCGQSGRVHRGDGQERGLLGRDRI